MQFTGLTMTDLDNHDNRIATLGRGLGALRLALGEGLLRLSTGDIQDFGFPTFESYVREALGRTSRWGIDVRALARRLRDLPHLRAALASGRLSLSVVARIATPLDEAEWVGRVTTAPGMNVRRLRAELKAKKLEVGDDTTAPRVSIAMTVDRVDAWAFEQARIMVEAVGARRGDEAIEAMLAEGLGTLLASDPDIDLPATLGGGFERDGADDGDDRDLRLELAVLRERAQAAVEAMRQNDDVAAPALLVVAWPDPTDPADPAAPAAPIAPIAPVFDRPATSQPGGDPGRARPQARRAGVCHRRPLPGERSATRRSTTTAASASASRQAASQPVSHSPAASGGCPRSARRWAPAASATSPRRSSRG